MDEIKALKFSIELKQTAKGIWYLGSLKMNIDNIDEFNSLVDDLALSVEKKIKKFNCKNLVNNNSIQEKEEIILDSEEEKLFNHLKKIRLELAKQEKYPPYVIFHDSMLKKMAKQKPVSPESMQELIGEKKFEKYGKIFVKEIFQFI